MKYKTKLLSALVAVFMLSGCGDMFDLDINVDPNNPTQAAPDLLLSSAQVNTAFTLHGLSDNSLGFMGIIASFDSWNIGQSSFNGTWRGTYSNQLKDLEGIIAANEGPTGSPQYLGIAKLLKAFIYANMVDYFGDIPYTEALKGDAAEAIKAPKFDDDQTIYNDLLRLIDEGLANVTDPRRPVTVNGDIIYGGNTARWEKFGNTLKMRMYLNTRLVDAAKSKSEIEKLMSSGKLISANNEDFTFPFSKLVTPNFRHPWYNASYSSGTNGFTYILHQPMLEMLEDGDPRWPYYFRRITGQVLDQEDPSQRNTTPCSQAACSIGYFPLSPVIEKRLYTDKGSTKDAKALTFLAGIFGRDRADPSGVPLDGDFRTIPGVYPAGGFYDIEAPSIPRANVAPGGGIFPILTNINVLYYQIEAILALGVAGDARTLFEKAIRDHIAKVVAFGRSVDPNSVLPPITMPDGRKLDTDEYVQTWMARFDNAPNESAKLNVVLKQLWFSSWGSGMDVYNAFRRTGFPNTIQDGINTPRRFPLRLPYPQEELTINPNAGSYKDVIYDRDPIFWDK